MLRKEILFRGIDKWEGKNKSLDDAPEKGRGNEDVEEQSRWKKKEQREFSLS